MNKKLIASYLLLVAWMTVIFMLSSEGHNTSSGRSDAIVHTLQSVGLSFVPVDMLTFLTRKAAHMIAYAILGVLAYNLLCHYQLTMRKRFVLSVLIVALYATSDEIHQLFVGGRSGQVSDVLLDTLAGVVAISLTSPYIRNIYLRKKQ